MNRTILLLAALGVATPVLAQPDSNEVSSVTVMPGGPAAVLTASYPAAGATVAGGVLVLKAVFDQPMDPHSFAVVAAPGGEAMDCLREARLLGDEKTFVLLCRARLSKVYTAAITARAAGGAPAAPTTLAFTTTSAPPVNNLKAAMKAAALADTDMPVVETPGLAAPD